MDVSGVIVRTMVWVRAGTHVVPVRDAVSWSCHVPVSCGNGVLPADAVKLVAAGIVAVMARAVTARETEESHCGHPSSAEYQTEDVEVHRSKR